MIRSGSHVLVGTLELGGPAQAALDAWLASQQFADEFEERDARWWLETVAWARGNTLGLWEDGRSSYQLVEERQAMIDELAAGAVSGEVRIVHTDNGHHVTTWKIAGGKVERSQSEAKRAPSMKVPDELREFLEAKQQEVEERYGSLGVADELREFVLRAASSRCVILEGGDAALRARFADVLAKARAKTDTPASRYICDVLALDGAEQGKLVEALREDPDTLIVVGAAGDLQQAIVDCKLREDLFFRISAGPRWNLDEHGDGLASALG